MQPKLSSGLVLEVLDGIGDVQPLARQVGGRKGPIENSSRRSDEGSARQIFPVARLLADEHHQSGGGAVAADALRGVAPQIAPAAAIERGLETSERGQRGRIVSLVHGIHSDQAMGWAASCSFPLQARLAIATPKAATAIPSHAAGGMISPIAMKAMAAATGGTRK